MRPRRLSPSSRPAGPVCLARAHASPAGVGPAVEPHRPRRPGRVTGGWLPRPVDVRGATEARARREPPRDQYPRRPHPVASGQTLRRAGVDTRPDPAPPHRPARGARRSRGADRTPDASPGPGAAGLGVPRRRSSDTSARTRRWRSPRSTDCWTARALSRPFRALGSHARGALSGELGQHRIVVAEGRPARAGDHPAGDEAGAPGGGTKMPSQW